MNNAWFPIHIHIDEAKKLREILSQSAAPGSLQSGLITRIDAALEEAQRNRKGREALFQPTS